MKSAWFVNLVGAWALTLVIGAAKAFVDSDILWEVVAAPVLTINGLMFIVTAIRQLWWKFLRVRETLEE